LKPIAFGIAAVAEGKAIASDYFVHVYIAGQQLVTGGGHVGDFEHNLGVFWFSSGGGGRSLMERKEASTSAECDPFCVGLAGQFKTEDILVEGGAARDILHEKNDAIEGAEHESE